MKTDGAAEGMGRAVDDVDTRADDADTKAEGNNGATSS
jgi:hypothetical protein